MLLNSHISAYATCLARKVCSLVRSTLQILKFRGILIFVLGVLN